MTSYSVAKNMYYTWQWIITNLILMKRQGKAYGSEGLMISGHHHPRPHITPEELHAIVFIAMLGPFNMSLICNNNSVEDSVGSGGRQRLRAYIHSRNRWQRLMLHPESQAIHLHKFSGSPCTGSFASLSSVYFNKLLIILQLNAWTL